MVRCHDSSINSIVAGGAASYILVSLQSEALPHRCLVVLEELRTW